MRSVRVISLYLATAIIMLHSFVAHSHHENVAASEHLEEHHELNSVFDIIALGFHIEHAEGQMEQFTSGDEVQFENNFSIAFLPLIAVVFNNASIEQAEPLFDRSSDEIGAHNLEASIDLRGPPALS